MAEAEAFRKRELEIVKYAQRRIAELSSKPDIHVAAELFMKVYNAWKMAKQRPYQKRLALEACNIASELIRIARQRKDSDWRRKKKISELNALLKAFATPPERGASASHGIAAPLDSREELLLVRHMLRDRKATLRAEAEADIEPLVTDATEPLYAPLRKLWASVEPYGISAPMHRAKTSSDSSSSSTKEEEK